MPTTERPVTLAALREMYPDVPRQVIETATLRRCRPFPSGTPGDAGSRGLDYLPSEVAAALRGYLAGRKRPAVVEFAETGTTWIAWPLLKTRHAITDQLANRMARDGLIRKPRRLWMNADGRVVRRKFYPSEDVAGVLADYRKPLAVRAKVRRLGKLLALADDELVTYAEAAVYGFKRSYIQTHTDLPNRSRRAGPTPCPPIGRLIHGEWVKRVNAAGRRARLAKFRLGDLREAKLKVERPPIPSGCKLVRDALGRLAAERTAVSESHLKVLIKTGVVRGGKAQCFKRNFAPQELWYMVWADRAKIPGAAAVPEPTPVRVALVGHELSAPLPTTLGLSSPPPTAMTPAAAAAVFPDVGPPDGPREPNEFWWSGESVELEPTPFALLSLVWRSTGRRVTVDDATADVWGGNETDWALKNTLKKANAALASVACPLFLSKKSNTLTLS